MNPGLARADEASDVRIGAPEMALSDGYAVGYGVSKWASEVLLRDAHEHFGLPVAVFRPNMILAHSRYRGQINVPDMFTRLLFSVVATGLAPKSFYAPEPDGARARAHFDGLPVDFLAAAMRQLGERAGDGFETYNMINVHADDGISLDSFVDWIRSAGYAVERIADHADWLQRFEEKLRQLPDEKRRHSSLAILAPFARPHPAHIEPVRTDRFEAALGRPVPHIDEAFIHKYLGDMQMLALIPEPLLKVA
jgi:fatty acid CoA ligase FadD9